MEQSDMEFIDYIIQRSNSAVHLYTTKDWIKDLYNRGILSLRDVEDLLRTIESKACFIGQVDSNLHTIIKDEIMKK